MSKASRLSLIIAACGGLEPVALVASKREVREEVTLAARANDDNSTLDEGENVETVSAALLATAELPKRKRHNEQDADLLTPAEQREIGRKLFIVKPSASLAEADASEAPKDLDFNDLAKWADEVSAQSAELPSGQAPIQLAS